MIFSSGYLHPQPHLHCLPAPPLDRSHLAPIWRVQAAAVPSHLAEVLVQDCGVDVGGVAALWLQKCPLPVRRYEGLHPVSEDAAGHDGHGAVAAGAGDPRSSRALTGHTPPATNRLDPHNLVRISRFRSQPVQHSVEGRGGIRAADVGHCHCPQVDCAVPAGDIVADQDGHRLPWAELLDVIAEWSVVLPERVAADVNRQLKIIFKYSLQSLWQTGLQSSFNTWEQAWW